MQCEMNAGSHKLFVCPVPSVQTCTSIVYVCELLPRFMLCRRPQVCVSFYSSASLIDKKLYIAECVFVLFLSIFNPPA